MALRAATGALLVFCLLGATLAPAQEAAEPPAAAGEEAPGDAGDDVSVPAQPAPAELVPPKALTDTTVPYPKDAPPHTEPVVVQVKILVGPDGNTKKVELLSPPSSPVFDEAVLRAAGGFRFEPATFGGQPVAVEISSTHTFIPPPPPPKPAADEGPPLVSALRGRVIEMGTREPVDTGTVAAEIEGRHYTTDTDDDGRFRLPLPAGEARVTVHGPGYNPFLQEEVIVAGQELAVTYYVERERYDPYEIVVFGKTRREEVSRITLRGAELKQVPGTFGDPYRVIQALPGVASMMALLPFPIVRGATPSSSGFLLDGTRVPLLYHLLAGPSVVHPELIEEVQFFPGSAPVLYGGYVGGIIDGRTRRARTDEHLVDLDLNLLQTGGLVRQPVPALGMTVTGAGRIGYPGLILSLATNEMSLSYWDYQLRLDGGNARNGWTVFVFGARDVLETPAPDADPEDLDPPLEPSLILGFHRADLRASLGRGRFDSTWRVVGGVDQTLAGGSEVSTMVLEPSLRMRWRQSPRLTLVAGLEGSYHHFSLSEEGQPQDSVDTDKLTGGLENQYSGSALAETLWRPADDWFVRPGVRADLFYDGETNQVGVDPRLTVRYRLAELDVDDGEEGSEEDDVWLKGGVGLYHQPPRFFLPLPGFDSLPLRYGLLAAVQYSLGVEAPIRPGVGLDVQGFYNDMDPIVFDLSVNEEDVNTLANETLVPTSTEKPETRGQEALDRLIEPQVGRAYGLEVLVRAKARKGLYGWLSYTLSRSERLKDGEWVAYDFDRTHLVNVVAGIPLPRNWDIGFRLQYQSGKPATTTMGYNTARTDGYFRIDIRIDKRAVWQSWLLDFYVDVTNVALLPEEVAPGNVIRYVLPTVGLRGRL